MRLPRISKGKIIGFVLVHGPQCFRDKFVQALREHARAERNRIAAEICGMTVDEFLAELHKCETPDSEYWKGEI